jgi:hypothetical protein
LPITKTASPCSTPPSLHSNQNSTAEEADLQLGSQNEAQIGVAAEDVGRILGAVPKPCDLDDDSGVFTAVLGGDSLGQFFFDRLLSLSPLHTGRTLDRGVHLGGHVLDGDELVDRAARFALLTQRAGVEPVVQESLAGPADFRNALAGAVVVGEDEAVRRNEGGRAVGEAQGTEPGLFKPGLVGLEAVRFGEVLQRGVFERPHLAVVELARFDFHRGGGKGGHRRRLHGRGLWCGGGGLARGCGRRAATRCQDERGEKQESTTDGA